MSLPEGWKVEAKCTLPEYLGTEVVKYVHDRYKTNAVFAKVEGPVINLGMAFTTEINNNNGITHCLEHLCFKESVSYPKGLLDTFATRCGSDGTNAYTDDDHTVFTFNMVGQLALLKVMPLFLNHVLAPKLIREDFLTEIFHVNGKGENQGVVYSEMAGRENTEDDVMWNGITELLFGANSPYSYDCGGTTPYLPTTTLNMISEYHKDVYATDNLSVIITGDFSHHDALSELSKALEKAVVDGASTVCKKRGFTKEVAEMTEEERGLKGRKVAYFPTDDTSQGSIMIASKIKGGLSALENHVAADVVLRYLRAIPSSPLNQRFVHAENPAASYISGGVQMVAEPYVYLQFYGVPYTLNEELAKDVEAEHEASSGDDNDDAGDEEQSHEDSEWFTHDIFRDELVEEMKSVIKELSTNDDAFDNLKHAITKERISDQEDFEDDPHDTLLDSVLPELVFSEYPGYNIKFGEHLDRGPQFDSLLTKDRSWWISFVTETFLTPLEDSTAAELKVIPSIKMSKKVKRDKEKSTKQNVKRFGKAGLAKMQSLVEAAEESRKVNLSDEVKKGFPEEAKLADIKEIPSKLIHRNDENSLEVMEVDISACFVTTRVFFSYKNAPLELARYAYLLSELLLESDTNGLNYKDICNKLDNDFVTSYSSIGRHSSFMHVRVAPHVLGLAFYSEPSKAGLVSVWVKDLITNTKINRENLKTKCKSLLTDITDSVRDQNTMSDQALLLSTFDVDSYPVLNTMFSQKLFLKRCLEDIPATATKLEELLKHLTLPDTPSSVVVSGSDESIRQRVIKGLGDVLGPRPQLFSNFNLGDEVRSKRTIASNKSFVYGMGSADTATIHIIIPSTINHQTNPRESVCMDVLCESIGMSESELQTTIRGRGLAYHASVYVSRNSGDIVLYIDSCSNVEKSIEGALEVLRELPDPKMSSILSDFSIRNAKGSKTYGYKSSRATGPDSVSQVTAGCFKQCFSLEESSSREAHLDTVTHDDLVSMYEKHISRLLDNTTDLVVGIVCNSSDVDSTAEAVKKTLGITPAKYKSGSDLFTGFDKLISTSIKGK